MRKNIKKVAKIGVTGLLAAGLLVGSVEYASHMFVLTNKVVAKQVDKVKEDVKTSSKSGLDSEDVSKQETVYATLDANGKKTDVIVSDWLKNAANKGVCCCLLRTRCFDWSGSFSKQSVWYKKRYCHAGWWRNNYFC